MVIGIDASRTTAQHKTGVEWYGLEVIKELARLDASHEYRLYSWQPLPPELRDLPPNWLSVELPLRRWWSHTALSGELRRHPVDVLYVPSHIVPRVHPRRTVVTIHDIGWRHFRDNYSWYHYQSLRIGSKLSAKWAAKIIVPSQTVASDVAAYYQLPTNRLQVIPNGFDRQMFASVTARQVVAVMRHHAISDPYLLFLGRLEARKNVARIIEAFYRLRDSGLFGGQLVLAGDPGVGFDQIRDLVGKQRQPGSIVLTGYLPGEERAALLKGARAFVFPSLYEGFGIPILEAFAAGTPVLTSNRGATAEVAGDAALLVNPESVEQIHQGLQELLEDQQFSKRLSQAGTARCQQFGWDKTAAAVHRVLLS